MVEFYWWDENKEYCPNISILRFIRKLEWWYVEVRTVAATFRLIGAIISAQMTVCRIRDLAISIISVDIFEQKQQHITTQYRI
jgi:hypothetical protein